MDMGIGAHYRIPPRRMGAAGDSGDKRRAIEPRQYAFSGPLFGGMSGVVYACFGYVWISGLFNPTFGLRLRPPVVYILLGWLAVAGSGVFSVFGLHIANTAHVVGLICGLALAGAGIGALKLLR